MIAIILAAGQGTRLRPLTETRLKGSLPILNKPLLVHIADMLENTDLIEKIVFVVSKGQEEEIKDLFTEKHYKKKIETTIQNPPRGTADAVAQAELFLENTNSCLVLNGDILAEIDKILPELISKHKKHSAKCTLAVYPGKGRRYGLLRITKEGKVEDIQEKEQKENKSNEPGYINAGIYLFDKEIFDAIRETPLSQRGEYEITDSIAILGKQGIIAAHIIEKWMSIENAIDLFNAQSFTSVEDIMLNTQFHSGGEIGFKAAEDIYFDKETNINFSSISIKGPVLIGKGTLVVTGAKLGPRVFIGRDCEVGAQSLLKESLIMDNCRIEEKCQISSLICGEEVVIGKGALIKTIKISPEIFTIKRNRDKLEEFVIIGGKSILTTKIKISKGSKINAHTAVTKNIE